ncbi:hypothetical protein BT69DRAFT_1303978 [Atractiella rhizophila]|nr:hypothetical protein BT69DRAFT_1303978 [Atractiella rhizophila]
MVSGLDSSLDQIISAKKKARSSSTAKGGKGKRVGLSQSRKVSGAGKKTKTPGVAAMDVDGVATSSAGKKGARAKAKAKATVKAEVKDLKGEGVPVDKATKILVSNLPPDVTEPHIRELFSQTIGPLKSIELAYDANGKSKGSATVEFKKPGDANKAFKKYNKVLIDRSPSSSRPPSNLPIDERIGAALSASRDCCFCDGILTMKKSAVVYIRYRLSRRVCSDTMGGDPSPLYDHCATYLKSLSAIAAAVEQILTSPPPSRETARPIKIEILFDPNDIPRSLASRLAPLPAKKPVANQTVVKPQSKSTTTAKATKKPARKGAKTGKGKGNGAKQEKKTVEQLDQEMMDWEKERTNTGSA